MMTLRRRLGLRYAAVVAVSLLVLAWLTYHEFVEEPEIFRRHGIPTDDALYASELGEVLIYAVLPAIFIVGWWWVRKSLVPIDDLAKGVERFHPENLQERLPRTHNGDEVDRLSASFNAMADQVARSFGQLREFTLSASHEIKTPLTLMRAELETAVQEAESGSPVDRAALQRVLDETQRLANIVDALSLLAKADVGLIQLEEHRIAWHELVRECYEDALVLAAGPGITVALEPCEPVDIMGDRHRLRQLLLNLADNAVKHNQPGGQIKISLRRLHEQAELSMANTGPGIPPELLPRVFDRFVRGRQSAVEGSGLGLTIAQWIVQAQGGAIDVDSKPGEWTTFRVRFPLAPAVA